METTPIPHPEEDQLSPLERSHESIRLLTQEVNEFLPNLGSLFDDSEAGVRLSRQVHAGRFDGRNPDVWDSIGVHGESAQVVYGDPTPFGNLEGSLYTRFEENTLRVRWRGDLAMYLNGQGNYVDIIKDPKVKDLHLKPGRIEGRRILGMTEAGVETEDPEAYSQYMEEKREYDLKLYQQAQRKMGRIREMLGREQSNDQLVEPQRPDPIIVSHEKFINMVDTMKKGLQITTSTLTQAKGKVE